MASSTRTLIVRPFQWEVIDGDRVLILIWALDQDNQTYCLRVEDFPIRVYLELPLYPAIDRERWKNAAPRIVDALRSKLQSRDCDLLRGGTPCVEYLKKRCDSHAEIEIPVISLLFPNLESLKYAKFLSGYPINVEGLGSMHYKLLEADVSILTKFTNFYRIGHSDWIEVQASEPTSRISTLEREFKINWMSLKRPEMPCILAPVPTLLAYSMDLEGEEISLITVSVQKPDGERKHYALRRGQETSSNLDAIRKFEEIVREADPDCLVGYHNLTFDNPKLDVCLRRNYQEWSVLGRHKDQGSHLVVKSYELDRLHYLHTPGRVQVDLYQLLQRENFGCPAGRLAEMSDHFGCEPCDIPSGQILNLFNKLGSWTMAVETGNFTGISISNYYQRPQMMRISSLLSSRWGFTDKFSESPGVPEPLTQFKREPVMGLHPNVACLSFDFFYPSIIIAYDIDPWDVPGGDDKIPGLIPRTCQGLFGSLQGTKESLIREPEMATVLKIRIDCLRGLLGLVFRFLNQYHAATAGRVVNHGQKIIGECSKYLRKTAQMRLIRSDIDTLWVEIPVPDPDLGAQIATELTALFPPAIRLCYQGHVSLLNLGLISYAKFEKGHLTTKGMVSNRRDVPKFCSETSTLMLRSIFERRPFIEIYCLINERCAQLINGQVDRKELIFQKRGVRCLAVKDQIEPVDVSTIDIEVVKVDSHYYMKRWLSHLDEPLSAAYPTELKLLKERCGHRKGFPIYVDMSTEMVMQMFGAGTTAAASS